MKHRREGLLWSINCGNCRQIGGPTGESVSDHSYDSRPFENDFTDVTSRQMLVTRKFRTQAIPFVVCRH